MCCRLPDKATSFAKKILPALQALKEKDGYATTIIYHARSHQHESTSSAPLQEVTGGAYTQWIVMQIAYCVAEVQ